MNPFNSGPLAPERNPPIEPQYFQPSNFPITAIALGATTTVTLGESFGVSNNYVVGQLVRFVIPQFYGTWQLSGQTGYVISIPSADQVVVNINSIGYDAFNASPPYGPTPPQMVAVGDIANGTINATGRIIPTTTIPGAFINISPT